jgi:DNA-binding XRE family transcriptional regulator
MCRAGRGALEWRATDLAEAADISRGTIVRFEDGRETKLATIVAIREAFTRRGILFGTDQQGREIVAFQPDIQTVAAGRTSKVAPDHDTLPKSRSGRTESPASKGLKPTQKP